MDGARQRHSSRRKGGQRRRLTAQCGAAAVAAKAASGTALLCWLSSRGVPSQGGLRPAPLQNPLQRQLPRHRVEGRYPTQASAYGLQIVATAKTAALGAWASVSPFPPFSWIQWMVMQIAGMPGFWRLYFLYSIGDSLARKLFPGIHAQLISGSWLGLLATLHPPSYRDNIATRLEGLLTKQAQLLAGGRNGPKVPQERIRAIASAVKDDMALSQVLGSVPVLGVWHRLEKVPLNDPSLLDRLPPQSQGRWALEALKAGYFEDVEAAVRSASVGQAADAAAQSMEQLKKAVDKASFRASHGILQAGGASGLEEVEAASAEAAVAIEELDKAREAAAADRTGGDVGMQKAVWSSKVNQLCDTHSGVPAVTAQLRRLSGDVATA
mmetsp:Transcript_33830/g.74024  ORF Transcript_33830/g.74024 Transcript_33830/m.74024 type:complete len:382 (+) Transcript_33830:46-1191(+)